MTRLSREPPMTHDEQRRFWAKVQKSDGCWVWTASLRGAHRYGSFETRQNGKRTTVAAHRYSWSLSNGPVPAGMQVLHRCDVPTCVRPEHLFLGTQRDNVTDCMAKGRMSPPPARRLTPDAVRAIRSLGAQGVSRHSLARRFGVHRKCIQDALNGVTWKDVA